MELLVGRYGSTAVEPLAVPVEPPAAPPAPPLVGDEWGTIPPEDTKRSVVIVKAGVALLLNRLLKL